MSGQSYQPRSRMAPRDASTPRRPGPRIGRIRLTPLRVTLAIALTGGLIFLAWSLIVRDQNQVPLMATGLATCGLVFLVTSGLSVRAVVRAGREGRDGTAVLTALAGGALAVVALMLLAGAVIMSMIWSGTKGP